MSNYPAASMIGSGIYATSSEWAVTCTGTEDRSSFTTNGVLVIEEVVCAFDGEVEVFWLDCGTMGTWACPQSGTTHDVDRPDYED